MHADLLLHLQNLKDFQRNNVGKSVYKAIKKVCCDLKDVLENEELHQKLFELDLNIQHNIISHRPLNEDENLIFEFIMKHDEEEALLLISDLKFERLSPKNFLCLTEDPRLSPYVKINKISLSLFASQKRELESEFNHKLEQIQAQYQKKIFKLSQEITRIKEIQNQMNSTFNDYRNTRYEEQMKINQDITQISKMKENIIQMKSKLDINAWYPIGFIFISTVNINPVKIFEGTKWKPIKDRFLMSAQDYQNMNESYQEGGSKTHVLSPEEIPAHQHLLNLKTSSDGEHQHEGYTEQQPLSLKYWITSPGNKHRFMRANEIDFDEKREDRCYTSSDLTPQYTHKTSHLHHFLTNTKGNHSHTISGRTKMAGGNKEFNILPPYIKVYMWVRKE
ncbi:hypothetical protein TRFO_19299 [Tritrichomonas foetus]|uniref:Baseplate structural protein Gp10 C-terminal domain-containing protein n=1 Tax=Tritrichomonas foetus TaxID=1144522 RepID=A0A1J4KJB3_9EUKA|nr:hypothetical protein TRFO_19299 [Tritrichomonas foetus]|eukprot:OHT11315.1 hypothetical protein TRFO_19299 [Tritrichomonas foetus]